VTCIATDGKTMAADGRMCTGDLIVNDETVKIFHARDGSVVGTSGDAAMGELVREWFQKGENPNKIPSLTMPKEDDSPVSALILRPDGRVEWMNHHFACVPFARVAAIGSGSEVAIGLMMTGMSPREAVEAVARQVTSVGGRIMELKPRARRKANK